MRISDWSSDVCSSDLEMHELFDAVETLATAGPVQGDRLAILTNGGGPGVLAIDALIDAGGKVARLSPDTIRRLDAILPPTWSRNNPVDIIGDAPSSRFAGALNILLEDSETDAVLVLNRSEEHTSELQSLMLSSYAVFCL